MRRPSRPILQLTLTAFNAPFHGSQMHSRPTVVFRPALGSQWLPRHVFCYNTPDADNLATSITNPKFAMVKHVLVHKKINH